MKHLYIIGGTMGVGKTTTCQILKKRLPNSVFLDGDWCWDADPFVVNDETKEMVTDNICHLLNNFIDCSAYQNVIFCWVMHEQGIIDGLLSRLAPHDCAVHTISLVASPNALEKRLKKDVGRGLRQPDIVERSIERIPLYDKLNTQKVDVSDISPDETAEIIIKLTEK